MVEVVQLKTSRTASQQSALERLDELRARVVAGEIDAVAYAAVTADGGLSTGYSDNCPVAPLIGALTALVHRLCSNGD